MVTLTRSSICVSDNAWYYSACYSVSSCAWACYPDRDDDNHGTYCEERSVYKNLAKIETIRKVNYVVFDKTGTLTKGEFGVTDVTTFGDVDEKEVLRIAGSIDKHSSHIIGQSIVDYAHKQNVEFADIDDFKNIAGHGSRAKISGSEYFVGNSALMQKMDISLNENVKDIAGEFLTTARLLFLLLGVKIFLES